MEKHINQTNVPSGYKKWYKYKGELVEVLSSFTYEVSLHKYWKNGYSLLGSKLYKASKLLRIKESYIITKFKDYSISKEIQLIGVPKEFVEEFQLKVYKPEIKIKKSKKK